ncbi:MAG TPA: sigma-70 family RNA polymerase sigma factor [Thermoguttaceae bacterium]|nr:sigma-70 family RNA polymerase sigma factor [Thermoguttaceae bacterium]
MGLPGSDLIGRLLDRHGAALELYARQLCDAPEDCVQEALVELARQRRTPDDVLPWLYRVVRNKALSASRSARRRRRHETEAAGHRATWFTPSPGNAVDAESATAALESLSLEQREVVVAHLWGGLTFRQVGHLVGTSDSTAHRRYEAALSTLREKLGVSCQKNE